jgi:pimeloyl-ACP methyl ester carboxylesterase
VTPLGSRRLLLRSATRRPAPSLRPDHPGRVNDAPAQVGRTPIVAVPGLGLSAEFTNRTLDRLSRPSTVVLLPGFGLPAGCHAPQSPRELAQLLLVRLADLGYGRAILFGHSASCQIVAQAAAQAPGRVAALVLVGPTTDPQARDWPSLAARWLRTAVWERPGQLPLLLRDYWRTGLGAMSRGIDAARRDRIDHVLTAVEAPVLVVRGPHDRISPRRWADNVAAAAQHGQAETLSAGAHMLPFTHPDALAACIDAFLNATVATRHPRSPTAD